MQYSSRAILTVAGWWSDDAALELPETRSHAQTLKEIPPLGLGIRGIRIFHDFTSIYKTGDT